MGYLSQTAYPGAQATPPPAPLAAGSYDTITYPAYDADGNVLSRTDGNNVTTTYTYNTPDSRLTDITYPAGSIGSVHYAYDAYGRRAGTTDGTGRQTYTYDDDSTLASKIVTYTGLPGKTINYSYYPNGSRQGMSITGDANSFSYSYDAVGRLAGLTAPSTDSATWTYLDNGWLQSQSLTSAVAITTKANYSYNACGSLTNYNFGYGGTSFLYQYTNMTYDGAENRTSSGMVLNGSTSSAQTTYVYDNKNQLLQEQSQTGMGYANNFAYDGSNNGSGNATTFRGGAQAFNQDNQLLGADIGYDGVGNPTLYKGNALSFDPENRLTAYGSALTVAYNDDGLRAWKQNSTSRTYFLYDGHQPILTMTATGTTIKENLFGPNGLVGSGSPAGFSSYGFDPQGNTARMIRPNGSQSNGGTFDAFGKNLSTTGSPGEYVGFGAQWGGYTDSETGLVLFTHRFYDPATGRFLTRDPIGYGGGINLYGYTRNNPVNWADPSGLWTGGIGIGGMGFVPGTGAGGGFDAGIVVDSNGTIGVTWDYYAVVGGGSGGTIGLEILGSKGEQPSPGGGSSCGCNSGVVSSGQGSFFGGGGYGGNRWGEGPAAGGTATVPTSGNDPPSFTISFPPLPGFTSGFGGGAIGGYSGSAGINIPAVYNNATCTMNGWYNNNFGPGSPANQDFNNFLNNGFPTRLAPL